MVSNASTFNFAAAIRWARFGLSRTLARRADEEIAFLCDKIAAGQDLLLDTCAYIDGLQSRSPDYVADLLDVRLSTHSRNAIQELMHTVGVLDPDHLGTRTAVEQISGIIKATALLFRTSTCQAGLHCFRQPNHRQADASRPQ